MIIELVKFSFQNFAYPSTSIISSSKSGLKIGRRFFEQKIRREGSTFARVSRSLECKVSSSEAWDEEKRMTIASGSFAIRQLVLQVGIAG